MNVTRKKILSFLFFFALFNYILYIHTHTYTEILHYRNDDAWLISIRFSLSSLLFSLLLLDNIVVRVRLYNRKKQCREITKQNSRNFSLFAFKWGKSNEWTWTRTSITIFAISTLIIQINQKKAVLKCTKAKFHFIFHFNPFTIFIIIIVQWSEKYKKNQASSLYNNNNNNNVRYIIKSVQQKKNLPTTTTASISRKKKRRIDRGSISRVCRVLNHKIEFETKGWIQWETTITIIIIITARKKVMQKKKLLARTVCMCVTIGLESVHHSFSQSVSFRYQAGKNGLW